MGDVIWVDFRARRDKSKEHNKRVIEDCKQFDRSEDLRRRCDNIQGSLKRINKLIQELKNPNSTNLTSEELDAI